MANVNITIDGQIGGISILLYLQDLFMQSDKPYYSRDELIVLLDVITRDRDIFDQAMVEVIKEYRNKL